MQTRFRNRWMILFTGIVLITVFSLGFSTPQAKKKKKSHGDKSAVLWRDPGNIRNRDLACGDGDARARFHHHPVATPLHERPFEMRAVPHSNLDEGPRLKRRRQ